MRSQGLQDFFSWFSIYLKDRGLQFTRCGFKGGDDTGKHIIDLKSGFWEDPPYSTSKPQRWIFQVRVDKGSVSATHPPGYRTTNIGHSNTGNGQKTGLAVRIVPLVSFNGSPRWLKNDSFEVVALFVFPGPVEPGGAAEPFSVDVSNGVMTYKGKRIPYVFGGLLGIRPAADVLPGPAGATVTYGQILQALAQAITVDPTTGPQRPTIYNMAEPARVEALKQDVAQAFEQAQALAVAGTAPAAPVATEEEEEEEEAKADEDEIRPLSDALPIPPNPDLIGIDPSVYQQINAALASGKRHIMFYGPPGTGKTTLARWVATQLAGSKWILLTGSADWSSQDVIGGYQPLGGSEIAFLPGVLLQHFDRPLIIDELNRCDIDKVVGPLFTVLSGHQTSLPYRLDVAAKDSPQYVILPEPKAHTAEHEFAPGPGWRLIATINSIDKASLYQMSYALARRFGWVYVDAPRDLEGFLRDFVTRRDGSAPPAGPCPLAEIWGAINGVRVIGPAPIQDAVGIIGVLAPGESLFGQVMPPLRGAILDAFDMVMLPMLDGVTSHDASRIAEAVVTSLKLDGEDRRRVETRLASAAV